MVELLEITVHSHEELIKIEDEIYDTLWEKAKGNLAEDSKRVDATPEIWYRGQPDSRFKLVPSLYRIPYAFHKEVNIFETYKRLNSNRKGDEWDILFEMQHHDVPTRLLDWTETRDVALFFALREPDRNNPTLYLLNPHCLRYENGKKESIGLQRFKTIYPSYLDYLKKKSRGQYKHPIALKPDLQEGRMEAQRSTFTLHGSDKRPIEELDPGAVARIKMTNNAADEIWKFINKSWDALRIFRDKVGLAYHIKKIFSLDNRLDRHIGIELRQRWLEDFRIFQNQEDQEHKPFFVGLQGCVVGENNYIDPPVKKTKQKATSMNKDSISLYDWFTMKENSRVCFVLGGAGSGKTNYILDAVHSLYIGKNKLQNVIWCALGQLKEREGVFELTANMLKTLLEDPFKAQVNSQTVKELCRSEQTVLVLDGLDELARTRGNHEAQRIISEANRDLAEAPNLRVIVGCRDHVYENSARFWAQEFGEITEFWLYNLEPEKVAEAIGIELNKKEPVPQACEIAARIPLFLSAARHLAIPPDELKEVTSEGEFRHMILSYATNCEENKKGNDREACKKSDDCKERDKTEGMMQEKLRQLGDVAALMIENRRDYLSDRDLWEKIPEEKTIRHYEKGKWPLFIRESGKEWRFVHQSIREYILAWNVYDCFNSTYGDRGLTSETSSLDFESAEVYCFVADLLYECPTVFETAVENCMSEKAVEPDRWNRKMRNLFEAVGMLGESCSAKTRRLTLKTAKQIIEGSANGEEQPYANFTTVYNAIRCVERLHPSGPKSHCQYRMGLTESEVDFLRFKGYAVRGFQKKHRSIGSSLPLAFRKSDYDLALQDISTQEESEDLNNQIVETLKNALEDCLALSELDVHKEFIATNLSLALARWLPLEDKDSITWLIARLEKAERLSNAVYCNLQLALWYRGEETAKVCRTYSGRVYAEPQLSSRPFLQALVPEVNIEPLDNGKRLYVEVPKTAHWLVSTKEKELFRKDHLQDLNNITDLQENVKTALLSSENRLIRGSFRLASGGTLPILEVEGAEYYCLFYREITPIGWNIANGGCDSVEELRNPWLTIERELSEELIIFDPIKKHLFTFKEDLDGKIEEMDRRLLQTLGLADETRDLKIKTLASNNPKPGPDEFELKLWGEIKHSEGFYLNINATDLGIEFDQVLQVGGLKRSVRLIDGEIDNIHEVEKAEVDYINAPVGLFLKEKMDKNVSDEKKIYFPDVLYWGGKLKWGSFEKEDTADDLEEAKNLEEILSTFAKQKLEGKTGEGWTEYIKAKETNRDKDLCPVTRMIMQRTLSHSFQSN
jgi:FRG domain/NACHT domain